MPSHSTCKLKHDNFLKLHKQMLKLKLFKCRFSEVVRNYKNEIYDVKFLDYISYNNTEDAEKLLLIGINPNIVDKELRTGLHLAASKGYVAATELLLKYKADPNTKDVLGNTPLHLAVCTGNINVIKMLINGGANLNSLDMHGRNPLELIESKLSMLRRHKTAGVVEIKESYAKLEEVLQMMMIMWVHSELPRHKDLGPKVENLESMLASLKVNAEEQMDQLHNGLKQFSLTD